MVLLPGNSSSFRDSVTADLTMYGWLLTPRRTMFRSMMTPGARFAVDNECYSLGDKFDPKRYQRFLETIVRRPNAGSCLFATAPDVVANAAATLALFPAWRDIIHGLGLPVALVAQDGLETEHVPWDDLDALFIGGSTAWKLGEAARQIIAEAQVRHKWVHVGRVNGRTRLAYCYKLDIDSVDGTSWAKHPAASIRMSTNTLQWLRQQPWLLA